MNFDRLPDFIERVTSLDQSASWVVQIFVVVLATLLASFFLSKALERLQERLERTQALWDDAAVDAVRRPLKVLIWVAGISFAADMVYKATKVPIFEAVGPLRDVGVIAVIAWALLRVVWRIEHNVIAHYEARGETVDRTTVNAVSKLVGAAVVITAGLVILQTLGFSIEGVLAFGGIGGLAVGFAAKDMLANFFGALIVYFDRPFAVGDWIRSPDQEIEGTVEHIGWRVTRIRTFDKRPLYVPNAIFTNISVENPSRMTHRRIYETIGIRYDDLKQMQAITDAVREMLVGHPEIDASQTMIVQFNAFNASSCDFFVYSFTRTTDWVKFHAVKQDVLLKIAEIIADHGAEIAFPTRTIHLPDTVKMQQFMEAG